MPGVHSSCSWTVAPVTGLMLQPGNTFGRFSPATSHSRFGQRLSSFALSIAIISSVASQAIAGPTPSGIQGDVRGVVGVLPSDQYSIAFCLYSIAICLFNTHTADISPNQSLLKT